MNRKKEGPAPVLSLPGSGATEDARLAIHGGDPVRRVPWPTYDKGAVFVHPEDEEAAIRAIRSHLYFRYDCRSQRDTECGRFEEELCRYFGTKHALAVSSGTTAIALAIMAAGIPRGSLIACPGFTFVATPSAIVLAGCTPSWWRWTRTSTWTSRTSAAAGHPRSRESSSSTCAVSPPTWRP